MNTYIPKSMPKTEKKKKNMDEQICHGQAKEDV
ncbi:hypothetical protein LSH36_725g00000 [Paralvinella palmiformis]|uniref:Uncharacterized protein n=1 Tax=Paralvinella palmiformis TaxID=53620 RepID=A0AAD9J202_9ANNE|nr:hypothetical protein LSH36_725g00000 [Paralvinella palmiformis]